MAKNKLVTGGRIICLVDAPRHPGKVKLEDGKPSLKRTEEYPRPYWCMVAANSDKWYPEGWASFVWLPKQTISVTATSIAPVPTVQQGEVVATDEVGCKGIHGISEPFFVSVYSQRIRTMSARKSCPEVAEACGSDSRPNAFHEDRWE